ncbi:arginyltransferase [Gemmata sp.]|uniref:arginyltransferase n=1 Tax=Gemmata sp. TaxID=1914242 RepID=UPI003F7046AF
MVSLLVYTPPPHPCSYLPDEQAQITYEFVAELSAAEYLDRLNKGWRRFGHSLFRPVCEACSECKSVRVPVATFKPDRSQRRALAANDGAVELLIRTPAVTQEKLDLYDRFHRFQHADKGWPRHAPETAAAYAESFVENPIPTEEWCYRLDGKLVGVGYVDLIPDGLSAIYFFHDPDQRDRSLGTFNVLSVIREAARRGLPHVYLGYYVAGCRSLEYKGRFRPSEVLTPDGRWQPFAK